MKTLLVNIYGAPCSGKSVKMMQLGAVGKLRGVYAEISAEVAKEYVVQHIPITGPVQWTLTREQARRMKCFAGRVDVLITDAPVLIGAFYARYHRYVEKMEPEFDQLDREINAQAKHVVNVYIWRNHPYDTRGRLETEEIDEEIARRMWEFVKEKHGRQPLIEAQSTDSPETLWDRIMATAEAASEPTR
jgi:hypothetical protein